jgi:type II secretory pathway component PulF
MPLYAYHAFTKEGKKISGTLDAPSIAQVKELLAKSGLYPTRILPVAAEAASGGVVAAFRNLFSRSLSIKDTIFFTRQLSVLLRSGVPLLAAFDLLVEQTQGRLTMIVARLRDGIKEGRSLADGLAEFPRDFEPLFIQLIRAGEATGKLEVILDRLTSYLTEMGALRSTVRGAFMKPLFQLCIVIGVVIVLLAYVVPELAATFEGANMELPLSTRFLMGASDLLIDHFLLVVLTTFLMAGSFIAWKSTRRGAYLYDTLKLKMPIVSYFARTNTIVQFSRTLGMLLEAGVNLSDALTIVNTIVPNRVLVEMLTQARENIIKQGRVAEYLKQTGIFPPVAIYLINTGEQSGHLDTMLSDVGKYYEEELSAFTNTLVTALDPALLIFMAVVVGFIVISIMSPITSLNQLAGQ